MPRLPGFAFFSEAHSIVTANTSQPFTPAVWCDYLEASGCTAIYMDEWDAAFAENYGALFADGLKSGATLYRVEGAGADMHFVPLNGEEAAS